KKPIKTIIQDYNNFTLDFDCNEKKINMNVQFTNKKDVEKFVQMIEQLVMKKKKERFKQKYFLLNFKNIKYK
ncbi:hypothetical protein RFI_40170, partial [Reticulomyxa filosa]